jgi:hypothetical protein
MIDRKFNSNNNTNTRNNPNKLPISSNGFNTTTSTPNYQLSGMQPNYNSNGAQNLNFNSSGISRDGFATQGDLSKAVQDQQTYINNNNNFQPINTFLSAENNSGKLENLRDFSQFNVKDNFTDNKPLLYMLDTKNKHNTIYDNLNEELMKETIEEYRINIDSYNRDISIYPNPFDYKVILGPVVNSGINATVAQKTNLKQELKENLKNSKKKSIINSNKNLTNLTNLSNLQDFSLDNSIEITSNAFIFDSPELIVDYTNNLKNSYNPYINRNFQNVKFIRLDTGILPRFNAVKINKNWDYYKKSCDRMYVKDDYERLKTSIITNYRYIPDDTAEYQLQTDRFVQIYIQEIRSNKNFGTNPITDKSFILIYDKSLGILYWKGIPFSAVKTYKDSLLGEINSLTIQFYDSWGNLLNINYNSIDYEKNQILNTDLIYPNLLVIEEYLNNPKAIRWIIEKFNSILECFIIVNYDIACLIPFYTQNEADSSDLTSRNTTNSSFNSESTSKSVLKCNIEKNSSDNHPNPTNSSNNDQTYFNTSCKHISKFIFNEEIFKIKDIYGDLNEFVSPSSPTGFVPVRKMTKNGKIVNVSVEQFINNVFWYDSDPKQIEYSKYNLESFTNNYKNFGFNILDQLKTELVNLPANKLFQNYLTFVLGIYTNELNTKVDFSNS